MIRTLWLKNFRRYKNEKFEFSTGINFIDGENNAGKTTLFYAVEYALFGRTAGFRQLTALMHPKSRSMGVELVFEGRDGACYRLQRMHELPPKSRTKVVGYFTLKRIEIDDTGASTGEETYIASSDFQDHEEKLALELFERLGVSRRMFDVAVNLKQGEIATILKGASELDTVLGVTASVAASEEMRSMALDREKQAHLLDGHLETVSRLERDLSEQSTRQKRLEDEAESNRLKVASLSKVGEACATADQTRAAIVAARGATEDALERIRTCAQARDEHRERVAELHAAAPVEEFAKRRATLEEKKTASDAATEKAAAEIPTLETARSELERRQGDLDGRIERRRALADGSAGECETCGQPLDVDKCRIELEQWTKDHTTQTVELADAATALVAARTAKDEASEGAREAARALEVLDADVAAESAATTALTNATKEVVDAAQSLRTNIGSTLAAVEQSASSEVAPEFAEALALNFDGPQFKPLADDPASDSVDDENESKATDFCTALADALEDQHERMRTLQVRSETELEVATAGTARSTEELVELKQRATTLERELAGTRSEVARLNKKRKTAEQLRKLAAAFKELQVQLREKASAALAVDTLALHDVLAAPAKEYKSLTIDPAKYTVHVTPKDIGKEVPAHLYQGGGHRLLLGLAFKLSIAKLVGPCPFVLLDEPTYGLDEGRRASLLSRISEIEATKQMVLITHHELGDVGGNRISIQKKAKESVQVAS